MSSARLMALSQPQLTMPSPCARRSVIFAPSWRPSSPPTMPLRGWGLPQNRGCPPPREMRGCVAPQLAMTPPPKSFTPVSPRRHSTRLPAPTSAARDLSINEPHATTTPLPHWKTTTIPIPATTPWTTPIAPPMMLQSTPPTKPGPRHLHHLAYARAHHHAQRALRPPAASFDRPSRHVFFALAVPCSSRRGQSSHDQCLRPACRLHR